MCVRQRNIPENVNPETEAALMPENMPDSVIASLSAHDRYPDTTSPYNTAPI